MWVHLLVAAVGVYVALCFVLPVLVVPFFRPRPLPARIPRALEESALQLEREARTPFEYVRACRDFLLSTNHGGRLAALAHLPLLFESDVRTLLARRGFLHATQLNHLLRILLVKSRFFSERDVRIRYTFLDFLPHQYVQVRIAGQWYAVDLFGASLGVPLGRHAWGLR